MATDTVPAYLFAGEYVAQPSVDDAEEVLASALIASVIPVTPPASWFDNPRLSAPSAITVEDTGRVFGHCAAWHVNHIGLPFNTKPPHSKSGYAYFHTGVVRTAEGRDVTVGQLTLAGGHANLEMSAVDAVKHYDDTRSAVADVHIGEDAYGIWVAGALRPGVSPEQIRALRASAPSGDWRPIRGRLELVAVLQVNVPGFPVARAHVASGYVTALVAAGAAAIAQLRGPTTDQRLARIERALGGELAPATPPNITVSIGDRTLTTGTTSVTTLNTATTHLIDPDLLAARKALSARVHPEYATLAAAAQARVQEVADEGTEAQLFKDYSGDKRKEYARKGWAMPDGSYPIANGGDLTRAIRAYGRAAPEARVKVRRHIIRRARGMNKADRIPKNWLSVSVEEQAADAVATFRAIERTPVATAHAELSSRVAALKFKRKPEFEEKLHPRNDEGKFRDVLFRLKREVEGAPGGEEAAKEIDAAEASNTAENDDETKRHIANIMRIVEQVAEGNLDPNTSKTLRDGNRELGRFVAGTTLPAIVDTEKMRYSDLPPLFQQTIEELLAKLESYVSKETYDEATADLIEFKRGGDVWNASELMASLAKILRFLMGTGNSPEQLEEDRERAE